MAEISYADLFDFSNDSDVKQAIANLDAIARELDSLSKEAKTNKKALAGANKEIVKSLNQLAAATKNANAASEADQKTIVKLSADLQTLNAAYQNNKKQMSELSVEVKKLNKERNSTIKSQSKLAQIQNEVNRLTDKSSKLKSKEWREAAKLKVEIQQLNMKRKHQAQLASNQVGIFQKEIIKLNQLEKEYKDVALAQGESSKAAQTALNRFELLNTKLTKINSNVGNYKRNVGNYASSWNGLGNSINQLSREAPAFAVSMHTGFLALSNNIPILADEINNLKNKNKDLLKQGKPTENVFKKIAGAVFSWQTLLSIGVTLLTVYGAKLFELAKEAWGAREAIDALKEVQKASLEDVAKSVVSFEALTRVLKDSTKTDKEKAAALEEINKLFPEMQLRQIEQARAIAIVLGMEKEMLTELERRVKVEKSLNLIKDQGVKEEKARQKVIENGNEKIKLQAKLNDALSKSNGKNTESIKIMRNRMKSLESASRRLNLKRQQETESLRKLTTEYQKYLGVLDEAIVKSVITFDQLQKLSFEDSIKNIDELKEKVREFLQGTSDIEDFDLGVTPDFTDFDSELKDFNDSLIAERSRTVYQEIALNKKKLKAIQNSEDRNNEERLEAAKKLLIKIADLREKARQQEEKALAKHLKNLPFSEGLKSYQRYLEEKSALEANVIKQTKEDLLRIYGLDDSSIQTIEEAHKDLFNRLDKQLKDFAKKRAAARKKQEEDEKAHQQKMSLIRETAFAVTSIIGNQIFENSSINRDKELASLQAQKDAELAVVGDNAQRRADIERIYAEKERQIKIRQAKADKAQALFNVTLNTSLAVTGFLARQDWASAIAAGVIGAAETAAIIAQPLPAFEKGGIVNTDGAIITSEKGREMAVTPQGKLIMTGDKGAEVRTDIPRGSAILNNAITERLMRGGQDYANINNEASMKIAHVLEEQRDRQSRIIAQTIRNENDVLMQHNSKVMSGMELHQYKLKRGQLDKSVRKGNTIHSGWKSKNSS